MPSRCVVLASALFAASLSGPLRAEELPGRVTVDSQNVTLVGPTARYTLLVGGELTDGRSVDLTHEAEFSSQDANIAEVSPAGVVRAVADGTTTITVEAAGQLIPVTVTVKQTAVPRPIHFENDVVPVLSRYGCNSSGCHGKAEGQAGFKLSVFGFDPAADHASLTQEGRSRRVFPAVPEQSLSLLKASGGVPHGGGVRFRRNSTAYRTLRDWIAAGLPMGDPNAPRVASVCVSPGERRMSMNADQQLRVVATYTDGREVDVTNRARFQSNAEGLATVDESGRVHIGDTPGEVAVMAGFMGAVDVFRALIPRPEPISDASHPPVYNFIDEHVDRKLAKLNIAPSGLCDDSQFLRRAFLDIIGTLPTAEEAQRFLADETTDRRAKLVDELLERTEYADYWALRWADLLRVDRLALGHKGAYSYYSWIRDQLAANTPYDRFAREIVAAEGRLSHAPAGYLYKAVSKPGEVAATISQIFLGVRIECAQCHHHPYDRWSQTDYVGMQAHFSQVGFKSSPRGEMLGAFNNATTKHPRSGEVIHAHPLGTANPAESPAGDRRQAFADWISSPDNPWFARNIVNRMWAHFLGRGLVEPVDDVRLTNPATNPRLLDTMAQDFVENGYDLKQLIRRIAASRTYQLSTQPNASNEKDEQNYSRALLKPLQAEVLLDAVCQVTGVDEKFHGVPAGYRAIQLWDSQVSHQFLKLFGRPVRATPCECERSVEPSVAQVLHVLNSPEIQAKLSHVDGRISQLVRDSAGDDRRLIEQLYLTFYSRLPDEEERIATLEYLSRHTDDRQQAAEDIAWSMMNTVEFLFNH